ncbi:MAG: type IV pilus assembly protein PilM [Deltaproteobacteria bacterium]|nr:type IV pilus assembly protein PilM [Deltaproteobacteria bacterium]
MGLFGSKTQIGVSIGTSSIKVAELKKSGKTYSLEHFGVAQLPDETIVNREIVNHMAVVDALRGLAGELKIKGRGVVTALSGAAVIVKKILLEQTPDGELDDAILWEAEQYVPFDMNEVIVDYQVLSKNGPEGKMEIVLVACKRAFVESYKAAIRDAGFGATCIDVDLFDLQNAFERNYPPETPAALVDIGSSSLKIVVCAGGQPVFSRDAAVGGRALTAEIQKHMNLSFQEAEMLKIDAAARGQMPQEVADLMRIAAENIAAEIKRSLDFFSASNSGANAGYILLSGGGANLAALPKVVEDTCGLPTQILNPFVQIACNPKYFTEESIAAIAGVAAIPVGLALRGFSA